MCIASIEIFISPLGLHCVLFVLHKLCSVAKKATKKKSWGQFVTANAGEAMIARIWAEMGAEKFLVLLIGFR